MGYKVGVSSGLYSVARPEELSTTVRKLGYALTRGTSTIEIAADVPNEVTETEGVEIRGLSEKQGVEILLHGSLTVPMGIPERGEWRDAQDHINKSIRSAVFAGAKYVNFHSCLNIWLELMTYAGRKLTMSFCDHDGRFISNILKENPKLRKWFIKNKKIYIHDIMTPEDENLISANQEQIRSRFEADLAAIENRMRPIGGNPPEITPDEGAKLLEERRRKYADDREQIYDNFLEDKLSQGKRWDSEELRASEGVLDGYMIMGHHMFYTKDPVWMSMAEIYKDVLDVYKIDYSDDTWLYEAWRKAETDNDRKFKEFFYAAIAAKYLEGHMKFALKFIDEELVKKEFAGQPKLREIAEKMRITIECPDARDPSHGGLHLLWSPRQIYAAVKSIRNTLNSKKIWMLMDYEHVATQGVDPIKDMKETIKLAPDFGSYTASIHANAPNPLQPHNPLEMGDVRVYALLYMLRKTGFGKNQDVYLIFERGGAQDPFQQSVEVLRLMVNYLEQDCPPKELPPEFFGVKGATAGDIRRQSQIITEHAYEPLKDLLEMPEEEWTMLSQAAIKKGKRPEQWKKEEYK